MHLHISGTSTILRSKAGQDGAKCAWYFELAAHAGAAGSRQSRSTGGHMQGSKLERISSMYGKFIFSLMMIACVMLFAMLLIICTDVFLRNAFKSGISWGNEVSEYALYLLTLLAAPWLLRQGRHIRVDILLRALPGQVAWVMEWMVDLCGLGCSLILMYFGIYAIIDSFRGGVMTMKTLVLPEWWFIVPLPAVFLLMAIEFVFRMTRLAGAPRAPRDEAVSAA
jgi:TRAP-type C4-dicarboxylate transport system permease small subunit